ncbi:MAG: ferritin-like domain-containing protein [bacterium]|nr:ferritin-like domain-containing protein [bacterium]
MSSVNYKNEIVKKLHEALEMEIGAIMQYQSNFLNVKLVSFQAEKVYDLFKDLAKDEVEDLQVFSEWIINFGGHVNGNFKVNVKPLEDANEMLKLGIQMELGGIAKYREILDLINQGVRENALSDVDHEGLYHTVVHIIMDEQEHARKMEQLLS